MLTLVIACNYYYSNRAPWVYMVHVFKNNTALRNVFPDLCWRRSFAAYRKASSNVAECLFWRSLPKMRKASKFRIFRRSGTAVHVHICIIVHTYVRRFVWYITAALSKYVKQRIVSLKERGLTNCEVVAILKREGDMFHVTTQIVRRCHKRYVETGSILRRQGSGRPTLHTPALLQTIEDIMQAADEATVVQIRSYLLQRSQRLLSLRRFWVPDMDWAGCTKGQRTVNLFARQTKRSILNGLVLTFMTILCKHPVKVSCMGWNRMAWSYWNLHLWWDNGCSNVRQDSTGSSPAYPSMPGVWERSLFYAEQWSKAHLKSSKSLFCWE